MAKKYSNKNLGQYEGGQYRGGRTKNPNLKKTERGTLINKEGVEFTLEEKKALESAVNTATRKRKRMISQEGELIRTIWGKETGEKLKDGLQAFDYESDFILQRKSKSLHQFKTKEDYNRYMVNLQRVNSRGYIDYRVGVYKQNFITALETNHGSSADDIVDHIKKMKNRDFMKILAREEELDIDYVYDDNEREKKQNNIRRAFGIEEVDNLPDEG